MMIVFAALAMAIAQATPAPAPATPPSAANPVEVENAPRIGQAMAAIQRHEPEAALAILAPAIAAYEADHGREPRRLYCSSSPDEALAYMLMAAQDKVSAVVLNDSYCSALYLNGFALVELKRLDEAKESYLKVVAMAPLNAQYQVEYAQLLALEKDWPQMLSLCEKAEGHATLGPAPVRVLRRGAALRCQGYALVELNRLDDAEKRYRQALKIDPRDRKAQAELGYIAEARAKAVPKSGT